MKDEAIIKATVWVEVPVEYIEDIKWFKQGEELAAKTNTLTINSSNIVDGGISRYKCEVEADGLPENFSDNMMIKIDTYNLDGSPRKPVFREPKSKDHGINGVARQKDVQKLEKRVEELSDKVSYLLSLKDAEEKRHIDEVLERSKRNTEIAREMLK